MSEHEHRWQAAHDLAPGGEVMIAFYRDWMREFVPEYTAQK